MECVIQKRWKMNIGKYLVKNILICYKMSRYYKISSSKSWVINENILK